MLSIWLQSSVCALLIAAAVNILAGITGSASGGMSIAPQTLGANSKKH